MERNLSEVDLNHITNIVYLDIVGKKNGDLEEIYRRNNGKISLGDVIDYYLARNRFVNGPGLQELRERFPDDYQEWEKLLTALDKEPYRGWTISNIVSNNKAHESGFVAYTIVPPNGPTVVAFRGSEPLDKGNFNDWLNNFMTSYALESPQQKEAREYIENLAKKREIDNLYLAGHSLGGNLANYASFFLTPEMQEKLVSCSTWGAPGFNTEVLDKHSGVIDELNRNNKYQRFCNPYDPTPALFSHGSPPIYLDSKDPSAGPIANHFSYNLKVASDPQGKPIYQRNALQAPDGLSSFINKLSLGLEALPDPLKAGLIHIIFSVKNGRIDYQDIMYAALALRSIPILFAALKLVVTLTVINMIVNELTPKIVPSLKFIGQHMETLLAKRKQDLIGLLNNIVTTGVRMGLELDNFRRQAFSTVESYFTKVTRALVFIVQNKFPWVSYKPGDQSLTQGYTAYNLGQLTVDLTRLTDLKNRMSNLERELGDRLAQILIDTNRLSSNLGGSYPEANVQRQIHEINRSLDQIRVSNRRVCDQLERKVRGLQGAIDSYRHIELRLATELWD